MANINPRGVGFNVSYNGVAILDCNVDDWEHRVEYDDNANRLYTTIRISVSSLVVSNWCDSKGGADEENPRRLQNAQVVSQSMQNSTNSGNQTAYAHYEQISKFLMTPGQDFVAWITNDKPNADKIVVAACGEAGNADYPPSNRYTDNPQEVYYYNPTFDLTQLVPSGVKRRYCLDCMNGPKPLSCTFTEIKNNVFLLKYVIELTRFENYDRANIGSSGTSALLESNDFRKSVDSKWVNNKYPVYYNRWSITDSEDKEGKVSHIISGKLMVTDRRYKPNAMRLMAFPLAFPFARRVAKKYTVSEDGKTLLYEFIHEHAGAAPPTGVRDYAATYSERISVHTPGHMLANMLIKVRGWYHRSSDDPALQITEQSQKRVLLRGALTILYSRIRGLEHQFNAVPGQMPANDPFQLTQLLDIEVIEQVGIPELQLRASAQYGGRGADKAKITDIWLRLQNMGAKFYTAGPDDLQPIAPYDDKWWPIDNEWGRLLAFDKFNPFFGAAPFSYPNDAKTFVDYTNTQSTPEITANAILPPITQSPDAYQIELFKKTFQPLGSVNGQMTASGNDLSNPIVQPPTTTNPLDQTPWLAQVSVGLNGQQIPASKPPELLNSTGIYSSEQLSSFAYVSYDVHMASDSDTGIIAMPLSVPRRLLGGISGTYGDAKETTTAIRLFSGNCKQVITIHADRINAWPLVAEPREVIYHYGSSYPNDVVAVSTLISKEIIDDAPQPFTSGNGLVYTTNLRLTYSCSRPWRPTNVQAGYNALTDELFPYWPNLMLKNDVATNVANRPDGSRFLF